MARQGGYAGPGLLAIVGVALFTCLPQVLGSEVIELTGESIAATIQDNDVVMLEFFAPWCGHCKELAPEFEETADRISQSHPNVKLAKIDCTRHQKTCENYGVQGYPTLKIFRDQKAYDYNGARKAEQMLMSLKYYGGSSWSPPREITMELTRRNYQKRVAETECGLLFFHDSTEHRQFLRFISAIARNRSDIEQDLQKKLSLYKVDQFRSQDLVQAEVGSSLLKEDGKLSRPEIKAIRDGTIYDLHSRNIEHVVTEFKALVAYRPYKGVWNRHNLETILEHSHNLTAVGIFAPDDDSALRFAFLRSCVDLRFRIECFQVLTESEPLNPPLLSVGSVSMAQPLRYRDDTRGEEDQHSKHPYLQKYEGPSTRQDLTGFFSSGLLTKVHLLTADIEPILLQKRPLVLAFSEFGWDFDLRDETSYWRQIFSEVVENYEAKNGGRTIQVAMVDRASYPELITRFGMDKDEADVSVAMMHSDVRKASNLYKMQGAELDDTDISVEAVGGFIADVLSGEAEPYLKSQRPPKSNKKAVKVVVARTFEKLVTRSNADVLIEFYAPWCPHCKRFAPKYRQLAKKLRNERKSKKTRRKLVVAKMDVDANHISPLFDVERIPSIYLSRASDRANPVKYTGDLEAHALERFLVDMRAGATVPEDAATKDEL